MDDLKDVDAAAAAAGVVSGPGAMGGGRGGAGGLGPGGPASLQYSIPGILHFLQHEWARFEMERGQWEVEKAELQARIAFLQGERKGQENLKNDLVRRIKMLEFALKQERAKYAKLRYGGDSNAALAAVGALDATKPPGAEDEVDMPPQESGNFIEVSNVNWRQGRHLLRQYLQEIGYTDTIIDVRSNRVRSLLGLHDNIGGGDANDDNNSNRSSNNAINGDANASAGRYGVDGAATRRGGPTTLTEEMAIDTEAAVMANFDFLNEGSGIDDDDDMEDGLIGSNEDIKISNVGASTSSGTGNGQGAEDIVDGSGKTEPRRNDDSSEWDISLYGVKGDEIDDMAEWNRIDEMYRRKFKTKIGISGGHMGHFSSGNNSTNRPKPSPVTTGSENPQQLGGNLELGELEQLTITNDNESAYDSITTPSQIRKTWNAKYTLRSHFDGVRALAFHPTEPVLLTASEDQTLKMWNLQKTIPAKKSAALEVEPVYTFRAHTGPVLSLTLSPEGDYCFSGGIDHTVRCWYMPSPSVDPYDSYDPNVLACTLTGHTDAVWSLAYLGKRQQLLSASADGTVKLWSPHTKSQPQLLKTFGYGVGSGGEETSGNNVTPTSVDWVHEDPFHMVAGYVNAACVVYDIETGKPVIKLDTSGLRYGSSGEVGAITKVVSHPTLPITITAHEDRHIRFFDNKSGKETHSMMAHLDSVTSLAVDANGLYLISGSHDSSVRLWNIETKTCVQEITAHRKKFDESIFDVTFHPTRPFIASAGADALAKVFV